MQEPRRVYTQQYGWNCFDVAVGFVRIDLTQFAVEHMHEIEYRRLLAPEIKHAAALAVVYMNLKDEQASTEAAQERTQKISDLFMLAEALQEKADRLQLEAQAFQLLEQDDDIDLAQFALPIAMHSKNLQRIVNVYTQVHEDMRDAIATCNQALGFPEGSYLSLAELDQYFSNPENQQDPAYEDYSEQRSQIFAPCENAFDDYCTDETICRQYINEYYAKRGWVSFQLGVAGEVSTSMVDIAARMMQQSIIIHDEQQPEKIVYSAKINELEGIHIRFNGYNHFLADAKSPEELPKSNQYHAVNQSVGSPFKLTSPLSKPQQPPVFAPTDYSDEKRTDLLAGLSGSLYQGDAAIAYMLAGIVEGLHFEIFTEVGEADKWDDIKIVYADRATRAITKVLYIQSKHGYDKNSFVLPANFYNKSGKAEMTIAGVKYVGNTDVFTLPMYFDDWLKLKRKPEYQATFDKMEFVLFSNRSFCAHVVGFNACFAGNPLKLTQDFIDGTGVYAKKKSANQAQKNQIDFRKKLFANLLNDSTLAQKNLTDVQKNNLIKKFLRTVVFKMGEKHLDDIEQDNLSKIAQRYQHVSADAIYYAFRFEIQRWLRDKQTATSFTDDTVNQLLEKSATKYLTLGQLIGVTNTRLKTQLSQPPLLLQRKLLLDRLDQAIPCVAVKQANVTLVTGPIGCGKSFAIAQLLMQRVVDKKHIFGEFLLLESDDMADFEASVLELTALKTIVIDLAEHELTDDVQKIIAQARKNNLQVVLLVRNEYVESLTEFVKFDQVVNVDYLSEDDVKTNLQQLQLFGRGVSIADKMFSFNADYASLVPCLRVPAYFCAIARASFPMDQQAEHKSNNDIYIEQEVSLQLPVYSLDGLMKINPQVELTLLLSGKTESTVIQILAESSMKLLLINLNELIDHYQQNGFDLSKFVAARRDKGDAQAKPNLLITADYPSLMAIPDNLRKQLMRLYGVLYLVDSDRVEYDMPCLSIENLLERDLHLVVRKNANLLRLPNATTYIDSGKANRAMSLVTGQKNLEQQTVLVAEDGAGKSTFTQEICQQWLSYGLSTSISWVCRVRLAKLTKKDNTMSLSALIISKIKTPLTDWQQAYIHYAVQQKTLLLILDGWDEVKPHQQQLCKDILELLFAYKNSIITSRKNAFASLPIVGFNYIKLLPFDIDKIKNYIQSFFGNSKFSRLVCEYLEQPQTKELHDLIGAPMRCFLLCKALDPYYQQWLEEPETEMPWHDQTLSKSRLYQLFVCASIQEYLKKHEGNRITSAEMALRRCRMELKRVQEIAFAQLFATDDQFAYEEDLDTVISYLGIVELIEPEDDKVTFHFKHQTYLEYFAALYLVRMLTSTNREKITATINLIKQLRYQTEFRLVWQFMAGIISYGDGQLTYQPSRAGVSLFWNAICAQPVDLIGLVHNSLVKDCLRNSNWQLLQQTAYGKELEKLNEDLTSHHALLDITQDSVDELHLSDLHLTDDDLADSFGDLSSDNRNISELKQEINQYLDENRSEIYQFKPFRLKHIANEISALVKLATTKDEKEDLLNYLFVEISGKYPGNSLVIISAIIDSVTEIGYFNEAVEKFLSSALSNGKNKPRLKAAQALIKFGVAVNLTVFRALNGASHDSYQNDSTWIADEALNEITKITTQSVELLQTMLTVLQYDEREPMIAAIFAAIGTMADIRDQAKSAILNTKIAEKHLAYAYVALCHLGYRFPNAALNGIVDNNLTNLIDELPMLLTQTKKSSLIQKTVKYLTQMTPNYQLIQVFRKLLQNNFIQIIAIKAFLRKALNNKNLTVAALQLLADYQAIDNSVINDLLSIDRSGFWLIDGGLPAIGNLADYFNQSIADYLISIINLKFYAYGVRTAMIDCCRKLFEDQPKSAESWSQLTQVLGRLFFVITRKMTDLTSLDEFLTILDAGGNPGRIQASITALFANYTSTQSKKYLWALMLLATQHSLAIVITEQKLTVQSANISIAIDLMPTHVPALIKNANVIRDQLIDQKLLPERYVEAKVFADANAVGSAKKIALFSAILVNKPTQSAGVTEDPTQEYKFES